MGLPMNLGIIGGASARFVPLVDLYRRAGESAGHDPAALKVAVTSYIHVAKTSQEALETFYPYRTNYFQSLGGDRVRNMSFSRSEYEREARKENALFVGSPQQIIDKLLYQHELLGHQRFIGQIDNGHRPCVVYARGDYPQDQLARGDYSASFSGEADPDDRALRESSLGPQAQCLTAE